jgi:hypothetical protein
MKPRTPRLIVMYTLLFLAAAGLVHAGARTVIGVSWSGAPDRLQRIIDATYGPGRINVDTDYLGARAGEPDQIVWLSSVWPILQVRELAGIEYRTEFGWYIESSGGTAPSIDGVDDAPVFKNGRASPSTTVIQARNQGRALGFYLRTANAGGGLGPRTFFTNRSFNDVGPGGAGALQTPVEGGDIQALVFDVSAWTRPNTWLVCFESRDSGARPASCCETTDNDFADYVFEVRAEATTANLAPSFGSLKRRYRD